jgi:hypothetical protein
MSRLSPSKAAGSIQQVKTKVPLTFLQVHLEVMRRCDLSSADKITAEYIRFRGTQGKTVKFAWEIAPDFGCPAWKIRDRLRALAATGYLRVDRQGTSSNGEVYEYPFPIMSLPELKSKQHGRVPWEMLKLKPHLAITYAGLHSFGPTVIRPPLQDLSDRVCISQRWLSKYLWELDNLGWIKIRVQHYRSEEGVRRLPSVYTLAESGLLPT